MDYIDTSHYLSLQRGQAIHSAKFGRDIVHQAFLKTIWTRRESFWFFKTLWTRREWFWRETLQTRCQRASLLVRYCQLSPVLDVLWKFIWTQKTTEMRNWLVTVSRKFLVRMCTSYFSAFSRQNIKFWHYLTHNWHNSFLTVSKAQLKSPRSKKVLAGADLKLKCKVTNKAVPPPAIAWYKDGALLTKHSADIETKK